MKKGIRMVVFFLALVVFLGSGTVVLGKMLQFQQGQDAYADVGALAGLTEEVPLADGASADEDVTAEDDAESADEAESEEDVLEAERSEAAEPAKKKAEKKKSTPIPQITMDSLQKLDMEALKKVNKDVEGWILIPGTEISYPVMQAADNEFYLSRTWDKSWNWMGSVFLEAENAADLSEYNTIIYGHNLRNSSMFSSLRSYSSKKYWKAHPSVYLANENGVYKYDIFAAYEVDVEGHPFWLNVTDEKIKKAFIQQSIKMSDIDTGIEPETSDRFITLSTCTGLGHETRWVVQAVLDTD